MRFFSVWITTKNEGMLAAFEGPLQLKVGWGTGKKERK